jgi:two-component system cell cycle sensor histidine kinase/response regulator CckA
MKQGPSHILAVNDRPHQLNVLASTIELAEYKVIKATSPNASIRLAIEQQPDLIIINVTKQQNALDLHRRIRSIQELTDTPILVIGTDANDFVTDSAKDDFLEEAYQPITLVAKVARLVEHKRTQDELRTSQQLYFDLFHNANDVVYTHDLTGRYTSLNAIGQQITGYKPEEIAGVDFRSLASADDVELAHRMLRKKLDGEATNTVYELSIKAKDGTKIPFEVNSQLIFENGKPVGVQGIARDIRARKEAEAEYKILVERIAQLAQVLASARHLDQIFNALLEFTKISLPCNALGIALYDHEQVALTPHFLWRQGEHVNLSNAAPFSVANNSDLRRAILKPETITSTSSPEHSILQDTKRLDVSSMIVPMTIMGSTIGILEIQSIDNGAYQTDHIAAVQMAANLAANTIENVRLLNREREQDTQLRQAQKMEAIGQLAGGVAHDFNNILTGIYGGCDELLRHLDTSSPLCKFVEDILQAGRRAADLTEQLLAYGRKQVLQPVDLNVNTVITQSKEFLSRLIGEDISINCNLADDLPLITADKNQLQQIIINLAVNARDAMPTGGTIIIETSVVYPGRKYAKKQKNNPHVQLSIMDTGIGMSSDIQKHIFEPFFTTKAEGKGTGLGLFTTYGYVKGFGGSISVSSKEGKGSTFQIQFPVSTSPSSESSFDTTPEPIEQVHGTQTQTILIAEDDESVRQVVKNSLTHAGYTVLEAINGAQALELLSQRNDPVELLITDVKMPQMNGHDLALRISGTVRVLYISGYSRDVITDPGSLIDGVNFLKKPFNSHQLLHIVRKILSPNTVAHSFT